MPLSLRAAKVAGGNLSLSPLIWGARVWRLRSSGIEATISGFRGSDVEELSVSRKKSQALYLYKLLRRVVSPRPHTHLMAVTKGHPSFWGDEGSLVVP